MHKHLANVFTFFVKYMLIGMSLFGFTFDMYKYIINGPIFPKDEESVSDGGADDVKQQNDDAGDKDVDTQNELTEANKRDSSPESSKKAPACKLHNVSFKSCKSVMFLCPCKIAVVIFGSLVTVTFILV